MKRIPFTKMVGAGNDFLIIDAPTTKTNFPKLAASMCSRTNGVGADGILIFGKSKKADYRMRIFNADGSEAEMCGNGARCMANYIVRQKSVKKKRFGMETLAGTIVAEIKNNTPNVRLSDPVGYRPSVPLAVNGRKIHVSYIDTGVPHAIIFVDNLKTINVKTIGEAVRFSKVFAPRGANVNFVEQIDRDFIRVRTYERGVEDETRACGTGSVAAAIVSYLKAHPKIKTKEKARMRVLTQSTEILTVTFNLNRGKISDVWLKGSAKFIAKGEYYV